MAHRHTVSGRRSVLAWLAIVLVLVLASVLATVVFIIAPQQQLRQQVQATAEARQAEVERLYQAGVAFQNAGDCSKAADSLAQVISREPGYKDTQVRLAEARACQQAAEATATAQAIAMAQATVEAQATATADARALAQAVAATATAAAEASAARATAEAVAAIETAYQRGLGYYHLERWAEAKTAFEEVFAADPTYKDVQTKLAEVEAKLAEAQELTPTATPSTSTPQPIPRAEGPPWWDINYSSRQQLTIGNNADTPLPAGYSVKLDLTGEKAIDFFRQSASTQPGDDVRIAYWDGSQWQEMDRYVESFTSTDIRMWFATQDEIPPDGVSEGYWAYFGNSEATDPPADPLKVFLWWDDFHINTVSKYAVFRAFGAWGSPWSRGAMSYDEAAERVSITGEDQHQVIVQPPVSGRNLVIEGDLYLTRTYGSYDYWMYTGFVRVVDDHNHYAVRFPVSGYDAEIRKLESSQRGLGEMANAGKLAYPLDTWHHITVGAYEERIEAWMDGIQMTATDATFREGGIAIGVLEADGYIDNIRVRKYVSPEPSVFLAPEVESQ